MENNGKFFATLKRAPLECGVIVSMSLAAFAASTYLREPNDVSFAFAAVNFINAVVLAWVWLFKATAKDDDKDYKDPKPRRTFIICLLISILTNGIAVLALYLASIGGVPHSNIRPSENGPQSPPESLRDRAERVFVAPARQMLERTLSPAPTLTTPPDIPTPPAIETQSQLPTASSSGSTGLWVLVGQSVSHAVRGTDFSPDAGGPGPAAFASLAAIRAAAASGREIETSGLQAKDCSRETRGIDSCPLHPGVGGRHAMHDVVISGDGGVWIRIG